MLGNREKVQEQEQQQLAQLEQSQEKMDTTQMTASQKAAETTKTLEKADQPPKKEKTRVRR